LFIVAWTGLVYLIETANEQREFLGNARSFLANDAISCYSFNEA
jgi:hypothetical protein